MPERQAEFSAVAAHDQDSVTISYQDAIEAQGNTLSPQLQEQLTELAEQPGIYDATDPLVATEADDTLALGRFIEAHPNYYQFFSDLYDGASANGRTTVSAMIPEQYYDAASAIADSYLDEFLARYPGLTRDNAYIFEEGTLGGMNEHFESAAAPWHLQVSVGDGYHRSVAGVTYRQPWQLTAIHELRHVAQTPRNVEELPEYLDAAMELGATCEQVMLIDNIMQQVGGADFSYTHGIVTERAMIPFSELAQVMRETIQQYGSPSRALMSQEFQSFLSRYYP